MPYRPSPPAAIALGLAAIAVVAIGAIASLTIGRHFAAKVNGSVTADATAVGTFSFAVNECASGHAFVPGFFGADLRGGGGQALRVVDTGDDARLWLYPRGGGHHPLGIDKQSCSEWDVLVDWAHVTVNRVKTVSGHVRVTCVTGGGKLTAHVDFEHCAL